MLPYSIYERGMLFQKAFPHLTPLQYDARLDMLSGNWFLGGGRETDYYGAYHVNYLKRIESLFPDAERVVHLFAGSLPRSDKYIRIDSNPNLKPDIVGDAEKLSTLLPFRPDLIYADPPYSQEDALHYGCILCDRTRVVEECGIVLEPGGYLVWLDQVLPIFRNELFHWAGFIGVVRSTGNRFRCVTILRKIK